MGVIMSVRFSLCLLCNSVKILQYYLHILWLTVYIPWQILLQSSLAPMGLRWWKPGLALYSSWSSTPAVSFRKARSMNKWYSGSLTNYKRYDFCLLVYFNFIIFSIMLEPTHLWLRHQKGPALPLHHTCTFSTMFAKTQWRVDWVTIEVQTMLFCFSILSHIL